MADDFRRRDGDRIGPWDLIEPLGAGGNAEVWRARQPDGQLVALKVLKAKDPHSEPYRRFRAEVEVLRQLGEHKGVLPLIDASLPTHPSKQQPAWLAMPIATGVIDALGPQPSLERVIEAVAEIADSLATLATRGVHHRDIKPSNLYCHESQWVIGDFGLADYPGKEDLTEPGQQLGPRHFLAPEMIRQPDDASGGQADVYSLAKTLWVLATGQNYPPPGQQRIDDQGVRLSAYVTHPRAYLLDRLIENATTHNPSERPSMEGMARELHAWLHPPQPVTPDDLSDLVARIAALTEPGRRIEATRDRVIEEAQYAIERLKEALVPIAREMAELGLPNQGIRTDQTVVDAFKYALAFGSPDRIWKAGYCIVVKSGGELPITLWCGIGAELFDNNDLHLVAAYILKDRGAVRSDDVWSESLDVPLGSAQQEQAIHNLSRGLIEKRRPAIERFLAMLEVRSS